MLKLEISTTDHDVLINLHQNHIHQVIRQRAHVILLRSEGLSNQKISNLTGLVECTIIDYVHCYLLDGLAWVTMLNFRKPISQLQPFDDQIKEYFSNHAISTIAQACKEVKDLTGVSLKGTQMRAYLKTLDIQWRRVGCIPAKVDIEAQQKFHDEQLQPRLEEAKAGKRAVYFVDSAHFVMGAFLGFLWCVARVFVRTPSGRQRFNVLGALNAITKELEMVTNDAYITSIQVCELLRKLAAKASSPITLVLDNARYQRCKLVIALAEELGVELLFLPPYSPNLNLIERLWKLTKKECLNSKFYNNFALFSGAILTFLTTMNSTHKKELDSLLSLKFQIFTQEQVQKNPGRRFDQPKLRGLPTQTGIDISAKLNEPLSAHSNNQNFQDVA